MLAFGMLAFPVYPLSYPEILLGYPGQVSFLIGLMLTPYILGQADFKFLSPACAFPVLGLKAFATMPSSLFL